MREIDTLEDFEKWATGDPEAEPAAIQAVNLESRTAFILERGFRGSIFLACSLEERAAGHIVLGGGAVIPEISGLHFTVHRQRL